jgi:Flp pilus assembly pilin Flp
MLNNLRLRLRKFLRNEKGDTVTQVVAIAAGVLLVLALLIFGKQVLNLIQNKWNEIKSTDLRTQ